MIEGSALSSIIFIALEVNFLHLRASLHLWSIITFVASTHSLQSFYFLGSIFSKVVFCDSWDPSTRCHLYTTHCLGVSFSNTNLHFCLVICSYKLLDYAPGGRVPLGAANPGVVYILGEGL